MGKRPLCIKAVLFDFDGTLTKPGALNFEEIRTALGCPAGLPILEYIWELPDPVQRQTALGMLDQFEAQAASHSEPHEGAEEIIAFLHEKRIPVGIVSRNSRASILRALKNFTCIGPDDFSILISRDDIRFPKPNADGILRASEQLGVKPEEALVVGDYLFDIQAGRNAGSPTVFLAHTGVTLPPGFECDFTISSLSQLRDIIILGIPLSQGKLPHHLLKKFLQFYSVGDPSVLVWPEIGEDTAAVDIASEEVAVLKSDPITFATDGIGQYAVLVNANDIATSGANPRWFLTSLLFPPGTTPDAVRLLMLDLSLTCKRWGISLCGGHTEITDAVTRPVVTGMLVGTVARKDLLEKRSIRPGDRIVMTKSAGIEGTAIIAREIPEQLMSAGVSNHDIEQCRQFLARISVLEEARIAAGIVGVSAMHDVTEGGIATAIEELSDASGWGIKIFLENIAVHPLTRCICSALSLHPLGLIGSGALLICCRPQALNELCRKLSDAGIEHGVIGEVLEQKPGVEAYYQDKPAAWPSFEVDELARLLHGSQQNSKC